MKDKKDQAVQAIQKMFDSLPLTIFGTGLSCAIDTCFGMGALQDHLLKEIPRQLVASEMDEWQIVTNNLKTMDLENSLNSVTKDSLLEKIIGVTGQFVSSNDEKYMMKLLHGTSKWPAEELFRIMVTRYKKPLHVATTNYDLLAEYSFSHNGIPTLSGFDGSLVGKRDWEKAFLRCKKIGAKQTKRGIVENCYLDIPHIRQYKVHGSLNTFLFRDEIVESNLWAHNPPEGVTRMIITPGSSKYKVLHDYRRELLSEFDSAVANHNFFLFLGFGFNDSQIINQALKTKLFSKNCRGLVLTMETNARIEDFLYKAENLWLICRGRTDKSSIIKNRNYSEIHINGHNLWDVSEFCQYFLGGGYV